MGPVLQLAPLPALPVGVAVTVSVVVVVQGYSEEEDEPQVGVAVVEEEAPQVEEADSEEDVSVDELALQVLEGSVALVVGAEEDEVGSDAEEDQAGEVHWDLWCQEWLWCPSPSHGAMLLVGKLQVGEPVGSPHVEAEELVGSPHVEDDELVGSPQVEDDELVGSPQVEDELLGSSHGAGAPRTPTEATRSAASAASLVFINIFGFC